MFHTNQSIKQPENQIVSNTLYQQRLDELEDDQDIPHRQYLSNIINLNLKSITNNPYIKYEILNNNLISEEYKINTNFSCVLDGFEIAVDKIIGSVVTFKIFPGIAIINTFIVELHEVLLVNFDTAMNIDAYNIVISIDYEYPGTNQYTICFHLLDDDNNIVIHDDYVPWKDTNFPLNVYRIINRDNNFVKFSFEDVAIPIIFDDTINSVFDVENSLLFQFSEVYNIELLKNSTVMGVKSLTPVYVKPSVFIINGKKFLIPNYGKHINSGYDFCNYLKSEKIKLSSMNLNFPIINPSKDKLFNMMFNTMLF